MLPNNLLEIHLKQFKHFKHLFSHENHERGHEHEHEHEQEKRRKKKLIIKLTVKLPEVKHPAEVKLEPKLMVK